MVGQAIFYRIRYHLGAPPISRLIAFQAARLLHRRAATIPPFYGHPDAFQVWGEARGTVNDGEQALALGGPAYDFALDFQSFLQNAHPVGRRLAPSEEAELCRYCYRENRSNQGGKARKSAHDWDASETSPRSRC